MSDFSRTMNNVLDSTEWRRDKASIEPEPSRPVMGTPAFAGAFCVVGALRGLYNQGKAAGDG